MTSFRRARPSYRAPVRAPAARAGFIRSAAAAVSEAAGSLTVGTLALCVLVGLAAAPNAATAQAMAPAAAAAMTAETAGPSRAPTPIPHGAIILTPPTGPLPRINGARVLGVRPGSPVSFEVPATGDRPMRFSAADLPTGLALDSATGRITGACAQPGEYLVTLQVVNAAGRDEKPLRVIVGEVGALTPPMTWSDDAAESDPAPDRRAAVALAAAKLAAHGWSGAAAAPSPADSGAEPAAEDSWRSMATMGFIRSRQGAPGGPGRWRELGPLLVGSIGPAGSRRPTRLLPDEQSTQISLWCLLSAPLRLRCDLARIDAFTLSLVTNDEVLALDQDALGRPAALVAREESVQTWARPLADGSIAVGFFNLGPDPGAGSLPWAELDLTGPQLVRDLWRQRDLGVYTDRFDAPVSPHGVFLFRLRPAQNPPAP
jgi:hypothetical protein